MNWRQSANAAGKRIEELEKEIFELEFCKRESALDIRAYNGCILSAIKGGSFCEWCNDQVECQKEEKTAGKGCSEWMLAIREQVPEEEPEQEDMLIKIEGAGGVADESEGVLQASTEG